MFDPPQQNSSQPATGDLSPDTSSDPKASRAVLTEAIRQVDVIHISLAGMAAIVLMLLVAVALPVFGYPPVKYLSAFIVIGLAAVIGIGRLYYLNYGIHEHISQQARLTEVLVNSLGQGFLVFDKNGLCGPVYSQACLDLLETAPAGRNVADVLRIPEDKVADFKEWMEILFMPNHALGFEDAIKFMPQFFTHSQGRRVVLAYKPIRDKGDHLVQVVAIATDETEEYEAHQRAKRQQNYAEMICRIFKERNQFRATIAHLRQFLEAAYTPNIKREEAPPLLRALHTLKATVKHFSLMDLGETIHHLETDLRSEAITSDEEFRKHLQAGQQKIAEELARIMGEIRVLIGQDYDWRGNMHEVEEDVVYDFAQEMAEKHADMQLILHYLNRIVAVPIQDCFRTFERELGELAGVMGKQVKPVRYTGSNPRVLTRSMQELLFSFTHICRNIVDHGIEQPVTRMARGKDPAGQVSVHAEIEAEDGKNWLRIVISDDGNGIDPSRIRGKLAMIDPEGSWRFEDDQTVIQRIFSWGFSTQEQLSEISGRGVGLEAVDREVKLLGGTIKVYSELYRGARFDLRIPYAVDLETAKLGRPG